MGSMKKVLALILGANDWEEIRKKGLKLAIFVPAIRWVDWVAVGVTATLVVFLKQLHLSDVEIFFILWIGNVLYSGAIVLFNDAIQADILLMGALRRLIDMLIAKRKMAGFFIEGIILTRLLVWDGPDNFILFFRDRLKTRSQKIFTFVIASGLQMAVWTFIYVSGYKALV